MDLILVRCADSTKPDGKPDARARHLTERGRRDAERLTSWLSNQSIRGLRVISSPVLAAQEMARMVDPGADVSNQVGPGASAADLLGAVGWPDAHKAVLLVAHKPGLAALASLLLSGQEQPWTFKKGALWWFSNRSRVGESQTILRCMMTAGMLDQTTERSIPDPFRLSKDSGALGRPDIHAIVLNGLATGRSKSSFREAESFHSASQE